MEKQLQQKKLRIQQTLQVKMKMKKQWQQRQTKKLQVKIRDIRIVSLMPMHLNNQNQKKQKKLKFIAQTVPSLIVMKVRFVMITVLIIALMMDLTRRKQHRTQKQWQKKGMSLRIQVIIGTNPTKDKIQQMNR